MKLIVNPAAAGGRLGRRWPLLRSRLAAVGFEPTFELTRRPGHATEIAARAVAGGEDLVVAAGGDGTICEVVEGLQRAGGGTLAVLPLGTGNDAARTLGLPLTLEDAARVVLAGRTRRVDLIRAGDRVVLNAVGVGLLGAINVNAQGIKHFSGMSAYLLAAVRTLAHYRCPEVGISTDGFRYRGALSILAVQNGPTTGGGFRLTPSAVPDDGALDATLLGGTTAVERVSRLFDALRGRLHLAPGARPLTFERLELATAERLPCHLDGNPWWIEPPGLAFEVARSAQEVVVSE